MGEVWEAVHRLKVEVPAVGVHLRHGPPVLVDGMGLQGHHGPDRGQLLKPLPRFGSIEALDRLGGINESQADCQALTANSHPQGVAIPHG